MAYSNHKIAYSAEMAYPELQPVQHFKRQPVRKSQYKKQTSRAEYILYIMINAALVFGVVQCVRALVFDGLHISSLLNSQSKVQTFYNQTRHENQLLKTKIKVYSSPTGIEELARNYLNMVGQNELPVRFQ